MTNKKVWGVLLGILAALVLIGFSYIGMKNKLVIMDEGINGAWAQVENQLQRRYDLIPNLVETVKGYAAHEKSIFENIANARAKLAGARSIDEKMSASREMESALSRLLVVVENYPNLKADHTFTRLMDNLEGTENRISVERRRYNESVREYNQTIRKIPYNIVASFGDFQKKEYFEVEEKVKAVPQVKF